MGCLWRIVGWLLRVDWSRAYTAPPFEHDGQFIPRQYARLARTEHGRPLRISDCTRPWEQA